MLHVKCLSVLDEDYDVVEEKLSLKSNVIILKNRSRVRLDMMKVINCVKLDERVVTRVLEKLKLISDSESENLMRYDKLVLNEKEFYILMRYIKVNLSEISPLKYFEENGVYEVLCEILNGLKELSMLGVYHGDLKPSNIFLNEENVILLSDYLSNELYIGNEGERDIGKSDDISFMSYEEVIGEEVSIASDIWSFGCIFYYLLSDKLIFKDKTPLRTMKNIEECKYERLECEFGEEYNLLLSKILMKDKTKRLLIDEILNELNRIHNAVYISEVKEDEDEIKIEGLKEGIKERIDNALNEMVKNKSKELNLCGDCELGALYLSRKLKSFQFITNINLENNDIGDEGFNQICKSFKYLSELKELNVSGNRISSIGIKCFVENIHFIPKLESLSLSNNRIEKDGIEIFSKNLRLLPNMKKLDFQNCKIGDAGLKIFCSYLKDIPNLEELKISDNELTDESIKIFCENIQYIPDLEKLDIRNNEISDVGGILLSKYLPKCQKLKELSIFDNNITYKEQIKRKIKENHPNKELYVRVVF